jgi:hypothetical protein
MSDGQDTPISQLAHPSHDARGTCDLARQHRLQATARARGEKIERERGWEGDGEREGERETSNVKVSEALSSRPAGLT